MSLTIEQYIDHWNNQIQSWHKSPLEFYDDKLSSFLKKSKDEQYRIQPEYLPEPYLGEMSNCSAVIINKNFGSPISGLQHFINGWLKRFK